MAAREREARGEPPDEAAFAARREFGNATLVKDVTRQVWGGAWLSQWLTDLRVAMRSLRRAPGFVAVAVLALGLGLGLSTTMFAVIDAVIHPGRAYASADRIFLLSVRSSVNAGKIVPPGEVLRLLRDRVASVDAVVAMNMMRESIQFGDDEREQFELVVPARWFKVVGVQVERGRLFTVGDGDGVAVISHDLWRTALAGRRNLAGAHITIGERIYAVIGVVPQGVQVASAFIPMRPADEDAQMAMPMPLVRLRAGTPRAQVQRDLKAVADLLTASYSSPSSPWGLTLVPWLDLGQTPDVLHDIRVAMVGSSLAVLLIACVNLAHLMLARGVAKRRELALRMALGAGRTATVRGMLAEVALVTAGGVALGALLAAWSTRVLERIMPFELSWWGQPRTQLSWRVFALGGLAAVISAALFGLLPALQVARSVRITDPLKDGGGTTTGHPRRYSPLVIGEVALALALLMGGALLLRSMHQLESAPTGFDAATLVEANVIGGYTTRTRAGGGRNTTTSINWDQALAIARGVPGVSDAALESWATAPGGSVTAEMSGDSTRTITMVEYRVVSPTYLHVHGLPILKGRDFEAGDVAGAGVAIISAGAAARLYPRADAVGRMLKLGGPAAKAPWVPIVGVARTPLAPWAELPGRGGDAPVWIARPFPKVYSAIALVRTATRNPATLSRLRRALRTMPAARASVHPYTWARDATIASFNFLAKVFVGMGAIGLGLAALGLYGVLAYAVSRRMREFGVRIALGAGPGTLFRMVMRDGLVMLLAGTGIGAFGALSAAYLFNAILFGVYPTDAISLVIAEAVLLTVGLAATIAPARHALRASPMAIIRAV